MHGTNLKPRLAAIQLCSGDDLASNLAAAHRQLQIASQQGACLAVLPENFAMFGAGHYAATATKMPDILATVATWAGELGLWIVAGTLPAAHRPDGTPVANGRVRAASFVLSAMGEIAARYDKIHLFDVDVGDAQGSYRESATFEPGDQIVCVDTPAGRLGLSVCYDLRFAELYLALGRQGAEILSVPSAFTHRTGEAHWEVLLRARAIENQAYVIGAGQGGRHSAERETWGHSLIADPWGHLLDQCPTPGPATIVATRSATDQTQIRQRMPVQSHRKL